jgi:catechol 2,3-dioxygenase
VDDVLAGEGQAGPDVHGVTQGAFLYVFEPGGNRIELFGNSGILQFEPDDETRVWDLQEFATGAGLAVGGTTMPPEFLLYGTPPTPDQVDMVVPLPQLAAERA